jgi:hypothetical protein
MDSSAAICDWSEERRETGKRTDEDYMGQRLTGSESGSDCSGELDRRGNKIGIRTVSQ